MVGDSLARDIQGAQRAGIKAIWLNRQGVDPSDNVVPDAMVLGLGELAVVVGKWTG